MEEWNKQLTQLDAWLRSHQANPQFTVLLIKHLRAWHDDTPIIIPPGYNEDLIAAFAEQSSIGWYNFLLGRVSHRFTLHQHHRLRALNRRTTGQAWIAQLIQQVWDISWGMWEHRNNILHSPEHPDHLATREQVWASISSHMELGDSHLLEQHKYLLQTPLDRMQQWTLDQQQRWLTLLVHAKDNYQALQEQRREPTALDRWLLQDAIDAVAPNSYTIDLSTVAPEPPPEDVPEPPDDPEDDNVRPSGEASAYT